MIQSVIIIVVPLIMCAMCHLNYKETFNIRPDTMPRKELVHVLKLRLLAIGQANDIL